MKIQYYDEKLLLYNVATGKLYVVTEEKRDAIEEFIKNRVLLDTYLQDKMMSERLIIESDFDESGLCDLEFNMFVVK